MRQRKLVENLVAIVIKLQGESRLQAILVVNNAWQLQKKAPNVHVKPGQMAIVGNMAGNIACCSG